MATLERVFLTYLMLVLGVGLLVPVDADAGYHPWRHTTTMLGLLVLQCVVAVVGRRLPASRRRWLRATWCCLALPTVFSAMGWLLPAVHPEPYEWRFAALDLAVFGLHPTVWLQRWLPPAFAELLQWVYASFYLIPITAAVLIARARGGAAFDRAMTILVFGFLASYLGYLLWPTTGPETCLDHGAPLQGVWLLPWLRHGIDSCEANVRDCFPSGHTMLSLMSLMLVWRWARPWFVPFAVLVALLVFSTMALRYHWCWDVLAGALVAWPCLKLGDWLLERDGAAPA